MSGKKRWWAKKFLGDDRYRHVDPSYIELRTPTASLHSPMLARRDIAGEFFSHNEFKSVDESDVFFYHQAQDFFDKKILEFDLFDSLVLLKDAGLITLTVSRLQEVFTKDPAKIVQVEQYYPYMKFLEYMFIIFQN